MADAGKQAKEIRRKGDKIGIVRIVMQFKILLQFKRRQTCLSGLASRPPPCFKINGWRSIVLKKIS